MSDKQFGNIINSNGSGYDIGSGGYGEIGLSLIDAERLDITSLKNKLFQEKIIIKEKPPTIDQMVASALSRLNVSIEAECNWAKLQIKKSFEKLKLEEELRDYIYKYSLSFNNLTVYKK